MRPLFFFLSALLFFGGKSPNDFSAIKHIVVIGVDGMSPDGILKANTPNMDALIKTGAHSFSAQAVLPTVSSPNWASMMMGASPKRHGVKSNKWEVEDVKKKSFCGNAKGEIFPTIYRVIREQRKDAVIACFYDWDGYGRLVEENVCTVKQDCAGENKTMDATAAYLAKEKPLFTFIHLDHVDHAGHEYGHGTKEYYRSVEKTDSLVGVVVQTLKDAGIYENTVLLITADHGGKKKGHGGRSQQERTIPWIITGPGVVAGKSISSPIHTYDTAPTLAYILGLQVPDCWEGKVVKEAFTD
ncbi:MAG: alkaline phosphatase [Chitinophagales bacterium]|nr:alkaline phosphatase [Chitinophagales bacterium]